MSSSQRPAITQAVPPFDMRPLRPRDLPELWLLHSDPRVFELDTIAPLSTVDQMERVLGMWLLDGGTQGLGYQLVTAPLVAAPREDQSNTTAHTTGKHRSFGTSENRSKEPVLGVAGLSPMSLGNRTVANTYVRFYPEAWGKGYAQAAIERSLSSLATAMGTNTALLTSGQAAFITAERNTPARRLAERIGYALSDEQDPTESGEHVVYLLDIPTWATRNAERATAAAHPQTGTVTR